MMILMEPMKNLTHYQTQLFNKTQLANGVRIAPYPYVLYWYQGIGNK